VNSTPRRAYRRIGTALLAIAATACEAQTAKLPYFDQLGKMTVDVDGAPNAYGPPGMPTLDYEKNAHHGGTLSGKVVGYLMEHGRPVIQGPNDPKPGYYVSTTDFREDAIIDDRNPRKYLDATKIQYVVLGNFGKHHHVKLGDLVVVHSHETEKTVYAIVGDSGNPAGTEGSLALLQALGYPYHDGKNDAVDDPKIVIRYYPGSNPTHRFFHTQAEINEAAEALKLDRKFH
jgi:Fungal chitosanase of glycosyl hydrolase group 75